MITINEKGKQAIREFLEQRLNDRRKERHPLDQEDDNGIYFWLNNVVNKYERDGWPYPTIDLGGRETKSGERESCRLDPDWYVEVRKGMEKIEPYILTPTVADTIRKLYLGGEWTYGNGKVVEKVAGKNPMKERIFTNRKGDQEVESILTTRLNARAKSKHSMEYWGDKVHRTFMGVRGKARPVVIISARDSVSGTLEEHEIDQEGYKIYYRPIPETDEVENLDEHVILTKTIASVIVKLAGGREDSCTPVEEIVLRSAATYFDHELPGIRCPYEGPQVIHDRFDPVSLEDLGFTQGMYIPRQRIEFNGRAIEQIDEVVSARISRAIHKRSKPERLRRSQIVKILELTSDGISRPWIWFTTGDSRSKKRERYELDPAGYRFKDDGQERIILTPAVAYVINKLMGYLEDAKKDPKVMTLVKQARDFMKSGLEPFTLTKEVADTIRKLRKGIEPGDETWKRINGYVLRDALDFNLGDSNG